MDRSAREFTWIEGMAVCLAMIGIQLSSEVINQWGTYFYSPSVGVGRTIYVAVSVVGWIFIAGTIWDALTGPVVGIWSDKTRSRPGWLRLLPIRGRRRPFIFWGSILMTFTAVAFWYPPVEGQSTANFIYGTVLLCLHWTMFGLVLVPLNSLPPEIARSETERVRMGTFIAIGMIVGLAMAAVLPGELITQLDPARTEDTLTLELPPGTATEPARALALARGLLPADASSRAVEESVSVETRPDGAARLAFSGAIIGEMQAWHAGDGLSLALPGRFAVETDNFARRAVAPRGSAPGGARELLNECRRKAHEALQGLPLPHEFEGNLPAFVAKNTESQETPETVTLVFYRDLLDLLSLAAIRKVLANAVPGLRADGIVIAQTEGSFSAIGYRRLSVVLAVLSLLFLQLPVWLIRERYDSETARQDQAPFLAGLADAARNRPFVVYFIAFFLFTVGFLAAQRALPYWAELGLGVDEGTVSILMLPFILTALGSYTVIPALARKLRVKWMLFIAFFIIASGLPCMYVVGTAPLAFSTKILLGAALFGYCGLGQGIMYVMMVPMMGEIIDYDEQRSGQRREALYNGLSGVAWKSAMAGSIFIATQSMSVWGNSVRDYTGVLVVGPIAGVFAILGMAAILFYPVLHVTREQERPPTP